MTTRARTLALDPQRFPNPGRAVAWVIQEATRASSMSSMVARSTPRDVLPMPIGVTGGTGVSDVPRPNVSLTWPAKPPHEKHQPSPTPYQAMPHFTLRCRPGSVYPPDRAEIALERFFTEANLTALRELSLRLTARRVEGQLEGSLAGESLPLVTDRVVVLVDGSAASVRAIRRAATLAAALRAAFVAVVVETPSADGRTYDASRDLQEAIDDAIDLGADVVRIEATDEAEALASIAARRRATHVFVPYREVGGLRRIRERSLVERVLERLPDVEVHAVSAPSRPDGG